MASTTRTYCWAIESIELRSWRREGCCAAGIATYEAATRAARAAAHCRELLYLIHPPVFPILSCIGWPCARRSWPNGAPAFDIEFHPHANRSVLSRHLSREPAAGLPAPARRAPDRRRDRRGRPDRLRVRAVVCHGRRSGGARRARSHRRRSHRGERRPAPAGLRRLVSGNRVPPRPSRRAASLAERPACVAGVCCGHSATRDPVRSCGAGSGALYARWRRGGAAVEARVPGAP